MTKGQFALYAILLTLLAVLSMFHGAPRPMTIGEFFDWARK